MLLLCVSLSSGSAQPAPALNGVPHWRDVPLARRTLLDSESTKSNIERRLRGAGN